eukprot:CAMPEP_0174230462 /NCGR_PEP_ID=MMETSP0417-20130205/1223_1 /TAXON_ID=242541 /ORGANISM="Mayorella sp, Strain BSH-02190019" /LENGTH=119 /DNA_ID=CAMNT_0015308159 /DNA_START=346 /DNA_END=704 /DNA_ORIENTATION=-
MPASHLAKKDVLVAQGVAEANLSEASSGEARSKGSAAARSSATGATFDDVEVPGACPAIERPTTDQLRKKLDNRTLVEKADRLAAAGQCLYAREMGRPGAVRQRQRCWVAMSASDGSAW